MSLTLRPLAPLRPYEVWERVELAIELAPLPTGNPFALVVEGYLLGPQSQKLTIPAFWDGANFRLRVVLPGPGRWTLVARAGTETSKPIQLQAVPGTRSGFVERPPGNSRYFQLSNKRPYFLVGENICWAGKRGLADYDDWFSALRKAGGNFARLWMAFQPLETKATGLGRYDLASAAYFDSVLALAEKYEIRCMLCFMTYGELATGGYFNEGKWPESPYSAKNGGPVPEKNPEAFFTEPAAKAAYKQRLRYLVARYSAYASLGFWELWNEKDAPIPWLSEMAKTIKRLDPYQHPLTHSYSTTGPAAAWQLPEFDLTQTHRYGDEGSVPDIAPLVVTDTQAHEAFQKPHLMGEFGISWRGPDTQFDPKNTATNLHNGLWASALSGAAGGAAIWWWDSYVHPKNLYATFTGLAKFAATIPWNQRHFEPLALPAAHIPASGKETFRDLVLTPTGGWGDKATGLTTIASDGAVNGALPGFFYGPGKPELRAPLLLKVTLPQPAELILRILTVSDRAKLVVSIDDKPAASFAFNAAPNTGQDYTSTKHFPEYGGIYQALYNKDRKVALPAGTHTLRIENTDGDWVSLGGYTLTGAWSSRFVHLRTVALQDAASGETLIWIQDPESNWKNDRDGKTPQTFTGVQLTVPVPKATPYTAQWWDTRRGTIIKTERLSPPHKPLTLTLPSFTRDIAVQLRPS
ncbi:hypothetical protein [Armatimonas rosea]|uniref:DUF5060 domain-containing protein n=1 Tax=Armatimonas rosea TaxID=685828 RepID=A0A7W9W862_ARMRO|nr:hypothetical protein [Armatimonas rosea]MBB6053179.1 hypothetical protein [Armatimonas rosea]